MSNIKDYMDWVRETKKPIPNTYNTQQQIHEQVQRIAKKEGVEIKIESDYYYSTNGQKWNKDFELIPWEVDLSNYTTAIQEPQIRQILLALQEVLQFKGMDIKMLIPELNLQIEQDFSQGFLQRLAQVMKENILVGESIYSFAVNYHIYRLQEEGIGTATTKALCERWLNGLTPMFETNPDQVLTELLEILKTL
jgi:hypothetical protein